MDNGIFPNNYGLEFLDPKDCWIVVDGIVSSRIEKDGARFKISHSPFHCTHKETIFIVSLKELQGVWEGCHSQFSE